MLKKRIVGLLVVKGGIVVQSVGFKRYLPVGRPSIAIEYLNRWGIDEIVLLDIDATTRPEGPNVGMIAEYARHCQVPLTIGGGIKTVKDVARLVYSGADKIAINAAAVSTPSLVTESARDFGSQCIVVSMDARRMADGSHRIFTHSGRIDTGLEAVDLAKRAEALGAGEILLNSIDRDGSGSGFDLDLIRGVAGAVTIPVIACGGAGRPEHLLEAARLDIPAVAAGNFFHFTEHSVITAKRCLRDAGLDIRLDSCATYDGARFGPDGRMTMRDESVLEGLRFEYIPEEKI